MVQHNKDTNAVTVSDDCPRDLLANHFTWKHMAAEVNRALDMARTEAQRLHGESEKLPLLVTDDGLSFMAGRFQEYIREFFRYLRIAYRTPTQLSLLKRFDQTLKRCIGACITVRGMREPVSTSFASAIPGASSLGTGSSRGMR